MTIIEFLKARIAEDEANAGSWYESWKDTMDSMEDRILAECAAKRRIVELHYQDVVPGKFDLAEDHACDRGWGDVAYTEDCTTLRALAAVYSDHPDYRDEWRA